MADSIENLSQLLSNFLGTTKTIKSQKITRLTALGDNYGSLMLRVDLTVENKEINQEEELHVVAKKIPPTEEFQEIFNIQVTFKKEVAFYETIIPALQGFQREMGCTRVIDCFPSSYGARLNMNFSDLVDENAVLVLENLVSSGFSTADRFQGFDLKGTRSLLKALAEFHSVSLALKLKNPKCFEENIKKYCHDYGFDHDAEKIYQKCARNILLENENCAKVADSIRYLGEIPRPAAREPFATLIHFDLWVNNTMQKHVGGEIVNKLVDFQLYTYGLPAADLFFFLWSSVQQEVIEEHLDDLIRYYHDVFIQSLDGLHCDTEPFGLDQFLEEIRLEADFEFGHALCFSTFVVRAVKPPETNEHYELPTTEEELEKNISLDVKKRAWYMTEECQKRGWLGNSGY